MIKKVSIWVMYLCMLTSFSAVSAQENATIPDHAVNISFQEFAEKIEDEFGYKFFYEDKWVKNLTVEKSYQGQTLRETLLDIFYKYDIGFYFMYNYAVVLVKDVGRDTLIEKIKKEGDHIDRTIIGSPKIDGVGKQLKLTGVITHADQSGKELAGVSVLVDDQVQTVSQADGTYEVVVSSGNHIITFEASGMEAEFIWLGIYRNGKIDVTLQDEAILLSEVVISEKIADENFETNIAGKTKISALEIQEIPAFLGEVDVIKSIQTLPGVSSPGEVGSGINVRGGSADQNLILFDNMMVFNPTHLFGFFSAFHPDAVQDVNFYKGTIPAQYGGRLSSVIDIKQKEGDYNKFNLSGGIGLVSSRLMADGPIIKDKLSFLLASRVSYSDWILKRVKDYDIRTSSARFSDHTAKLTYKPSNKDKLSLTAYLSSDQFQFASDTTYKWTNDFVSLKHDHVFSNSLSSEIMAGIGSYSYSVSSDADPSAFDWNYDINFAQADAKLRFDKNSHQIALGADVKGFLINSGELTPKANSNVTEIRIDESKSYELGLYISDEVEITTNLSVVLGLRYSSYTLLGPNTTYAYQAGEPIDVTTRVDSTSFANNEDVVTYQGLEPRFSARYEFSPSSQVTAGYSRGYQYMHLISNTASITPIDIWLVSDRHIKPQYGDQFSLGHVRKFRGGIIVGADIFYKRMFRVPEYRNGADLILNANLETELLSSEGRAYGAELSINKTEGRLKGQLSYTYSRSERITNNSFESLEVNNGSYYPSNYDRPHNLSLGLNYAISKRHTLSTNFQLSSGRPYTAPSASFVVDNVPVVSYGERNQERIPLYHRMDITLHVKSSHKKNKWKGSWAFTLYNLYARKNAYSVYFESNEHDQIEGKRLSILGTIFPAITYNFKL